MRLILLATIIAIIAAMQVPALAAWNIDQPAPAVVEAPSAPVTPPAEPAGWTEQVQTPPVDAEARPAPLVVTEPVLDAPVEAPAPPPVMMVQVSTQKLQDNMYFKTTEQMRILNTTLPTTSPFSTGAAVPEPGSIAGLSVGLGAILFHLRRARKR